MSEVELIQAEPRSFVGLRHNLRFTALGPFLSDALPKTLAWLRAKGIPPASPPMAMWSSEEVESGVGDCHAGYFVAEAQADDGLITGGKTAGGDVLRIEHKGPYTTVGPSWQRLTQRAVMLGRNPGFGWEIYLDDPSEVAAEELRTLIYLPLLP